MKIAKHPIGSELRLADLDTAREAGFIEQVKAALGLPADAQLKLQNAARGADGDVVVEYAVTLPIQIIGAEFGAASGVTVDERVSASLRFNAAGVRVASRLSPVDERHLRMIRDNVRKLAAANAIHVAATGEAIDLETLRARRQSWYVEKDAQGRKRLDRKTHV